MQDSKHLPTRPTLPIAWFPSSQTCSCCGAINPAMRDLKRRVFICPECGFIEGRDRNAARNIYWYGEERRNRAREGATDGEIGDHDEACLARVLVGEPSMLTALAHADESQIIPSGDVRC